MKIAVTLFQLIPAGFFLWIGPRAGMSAFESLVIAMLWMITATVLFLEADIRAKAK